VKFGSHRRFIPRKKVALIAENSVPRKQLSILSLRPRTCHAICSRHQTSFSASVGDCEGATAPIALCTDYVVETTLLPAASPVSNRTSRAGIEKNPSTEKNHGAVNLSSKVP